MIMTKLDENLFWLRICTDLAPAYSNLETKSEPSPDFSALGEERLYTDEFVNRFNEALRDNGFFSGTSLGWRLKENCPACPCGDHDGCFHYVCEC